MSFIKGMIDIEGILKDSEDSVSAEVADERRQERSRRGKKVSCSQKESLEYCPPYLRPLRDHYEALGLTGDLPEDNDSENLTAERGNASGKATEHAQNVQRIAKKAQKKPQSPTQLQVDPELERRAKAVLKDLQRRGQIIS